MWERSPSPNALCHIRGNCISEIKCLFHVTQLMARLRCPSAAWLPRLVHFPLPNSWEHIMDEIEYHTQGLGFPLLEVIWHWQTLSSRASYSGMQRSGLSSPAKGGLCRKRLEAGRQAQWCHWHCPVWTSVVALECLGWDRKEGHCERKTKQLEREVDQGHHRKD